MLTKPPVPYDDCVADPTRDCTTSPINRFAALVATQRSIQLFNCPTCNNLAISMHHLGLLLLCVRGGVEAVRQSVQCYDGYDQRGSEVRATEYMPSLAYHSFDNRIKSCCFTGIFSFHSCC